MTETARGARGDRDDAIQTVGQQRRVIAQPTAAIRNASGQPTARVTIWYPAAPTADTVSIDLGPQNAPYMRVGEVAIDAPFADDIRYPVILYSHGFTGSAATTAWFGLALARAGYVVVSLDHPGGNFEEPETLGGKLLWWLRADDLKAALAALADDPVLGPHVDADHVGICGYSLGGLTALIALGGVFDGAVYDNYCIANPSSPVCAPPGSHPIFDPENPVFPEAFRAELRRMSEDRGIPAAKAGFLFAPLTVSFRPESLAAIKVPVTFIVGSDDAVTIPEAGAALAHAMIPGSTLVTVPGGGHSSFLNFFTDAGIAANYLDEGGRATAQDLAHRTAIASALAVFDPALKGAH